MMYTLDFQVWRPAPNVSSTGCYSLVGNNRFTSLPLSDRLAESLSPTSPEQRIQVQPGDVLGFYVESAHEKVAGSRGVVLLRGGSVQGEYETEEVWYADVSNAVYANPMCLYPVGPGRVLSSSTNAAPVISVGFSKLCIIIHHHVESSSIGMRFSKAHD